LPASAGAGRQSAVCVKYFRFSPATPGAAVAKLAASFVPDVFKTSITHDNVMA
jgi:hypothetical protein